MTSTALLCALVGFAPASSERLQTFTDQTVAGTNTDVMIVRHLVLRGSNFAIGKRLAEVAKSRHRSALSGWQSPTIRRQQLAWLRSNYPERIERANGARSVYRVPLDGAYDATSLPIDMGVAPACSVVFYPGQFVTNRHAMLSRNYDFSKGTMSEVMHRPKKPGERSMTGDPYVIEMHPDHGYASLYITAYDLLGGAIDGVNSKGVSVALLADDMSKSHTRGHFLGLSEVDLPRFVLDRCANAKEARRLLRNAPYYATFTACHYMICDASGDSFVFEVGPEGKHYIVDGGGKPQIVTNHSLAEYGTKNLPQGNSFDRYRRLQTELAKRPGRFTPAEVREINYCVAVPREYPLAATMWHAVYDLHDHNMQVSFCLSRPDEVRQRRTNYIKFSLASD